LQLPKESKPMLWMRELLSQLAREQQPLEWVPLTQSLLVWLARSRSRLEMERRSDSFAVAHSARIAIWRRA
jgi:hypothetical protein